MVRRGDRLDGALKPSITMQPFTALRAALVRVIAALGAGRELRRPGIDDFIPAMLLLTPLLALPVFTLLLGLLRLATRDTPGRREPLLPLALDSAVIGLFIASSLVVRWRPAIDTALQRYAALDLAARRRWRLMPVSTLLVSTAVMLGAVVAFARR